MTEPRKRILLVEDELLIALDTQNMLEQAGYDVVGPATSLEQALLLVETETFHVAVLDINLGGTYVWPAAEQLSERGVPIILTSGFGHGLDVPTSLRTAPRLAKPLKAAELTESVEAARPPRPSPTFAS